MHPRLFKPIIISLLMIALAGGAYVARSLQGAARESSSADVARTLAEMIATGSQIGAAEEAYVAPGQPSGPWLQQVDDRLQQLRSDATAITPRLRSVDAADLLKALSADLEQLTAIDARIRTNVTNGQNLTAADLIFTEARDKVATITRTTQALQEAELRAADAGRAQIAYLGWILLALVAVAGGLAVVLLRQQPDAVPDVRPSDATPLALPETPPLAAPAPAPVSVDLAAAAGICSDISRVTSGAVLPEVLGRAAVVLDASGIILWMGAGEELFPVTAHGYDPTVLARLGAIGRQANNATAAAWRTGTAGVVAGDLMSNGAVVAPMFGVDGCIGVLAAEVRHGRESDPALQAVTAMFAAQFATIVAAWPAPSQAAQDSDTEAGPIAASL